MNRVAIAFCLILGVLMQALDTTIANVALPYMQGSLSASQDEIGWVLTSYIVAAAIMTAPAGFLANRFGVKPLYIVSVSGFTLASMLCGAAQTLGQIVVFRVMQGMFGAALVPLAQSVLFSIMPRNRQGSGMALFGIAVMVGPVLGPVLGGWLTQNFSWRFVFYVNLPIGLVALIGTLIFLPKSDPKHNLKLDWIGFITLSIAIGALQMLLDRGQEKDWFSSREIIIEAVVAGVAFYLFLIQSFTARNPFVRPALFKNRNFAGGVVFIAVMGVTYFASMALQPPYLQNLMGYPVLTSGLVMGPRGLGTMLAMLIVGRLIGIIDTRWLLVFGSALSGLSFYQMMLWTPSVSESAVIITGILQGVGMGFIFVPLSTAALGTLEAEDRPDAASVYNLARNIGSSVGISVVNTLLTRSEQVVHDNIASAVTPFNRNLFETNVAHYWNPATKVGAAAINGVVNQQAQIISYSDDYKFLMIAILAAMPLVVMFDRARPSAGAAPRVELD